MHPELEDERRKKSSLRCYYMNVNFITNQYHPESRTEGFLTQMEAQNLKSVRSKYKAKQESRR